MNVFFRVLWLGEEAGPVPVFRSMLLSSECSRLWYAACAQGLVTTKREDIRDTKNALEHFNCSAGLGSWLSRVRGQAERSENHALGLS